MSTGANETTAVAYLGQATRARRREEIARAVQNMPELERQGLVRALTAFTTSGHEPAAQIDIDGQTF